MNIVVLAGGISPERDVSLTSAALVSNALVKSGHKVCLLDVYEGLPEGKKPLIVSFDDVNYYQYMLENGFTYKGYRYYKRYYSRYEGSYMAASRAAKKDKDQ